MRGLMEIIVLIYVKMSKTRNMTTSAVKIMKMATFTEDDDEEVNRYFGERELQCWNKMQWNTIDE